MVETTSPETVRLTVEVRNVIVRDGRPFASFSGMNSRYFVPPDVEPVIQAAASDRRPLLIVFSRDTILSAEVAPARREGRSIFRWFRQALRS